MGETSLIGPVAGVSPEILKWEIEAQRTCFDLPKQRRVAYQLMNARNLFEKPPPVPCLEITEGHKPRPTISSGARVTVLLNHRLTQNQAALAQAALNFETSEAREPHPMMTKVDQYRLPEEARDTVIRAAVRENVDRGGPSIKISSSKRGISKSLGSNGGWIS